MPVSLFAALALAAQPVSAAPAQTAAPAQPPAAQPSDSRCLVASVLLATSSNEQAKSAGMMSALYYLGRLDGREPGLDLKDRIVSEVKALQGGDVTGVIQACSQVLKARGEALQAIGSAIQAEHPAPK